MLLTQLREGVGMAEGHVLARLQEMEELSKAMVDRANNTQTDFNALKTRLAELESAFQGNTAAAFATKREEWHTSAEGLIESLSGLGAFLKQAKEAIEQTDQQLAQGLNG